MDQETQEGRAQLFEKLLRVQRKLRRVPADDTRHAPSITPWKLTEEVAPELQAEGLVLVTSVETVQVKAVTKSRTDSRDGQVFEDPWFLTTVTVQFELTDSETGYTLRSRSAGSSYNKDGDGTVHALSQAQKQYLLRLSLARVVHPSELAEEEEEEPARRPRRIPEAHGIEFRKRSSGHGWMRKDTGALLQTCPRHDVPMLRMEGGNRWLCIEAECGETLDQREVEDEKRAKMIPELRDTYHRLLRENRTYDWQEEAIIEASPRLSIGKDKWGFGDWQNVVEAMSDLPRLIRNSLRRLAEETPASDERVRYLRHLLDDADLRFAERTEIEEAIQSGWHDAVEAVIEKYGDRKDQGEMPFGQEAKTA